MNRAVPLALAAGLLAADCGHEYVYEPAVNMRARVKGFPAAYYSIPATNPTGDVRLASFGVTELQSARGGGKLPAIQVRMIVSNNADSTPWTIDTREILLDVHGVGKNRPMFVNTDAGKPPIITIRKGQRHVLDLYYPLPPGVKGENKLPAFDVVWNIQTGTGQAAERTPFEREEVEPAYARYYDTWYPDEFAAGLGFGPFWWYDPYYPFAAGVVVGPGPYRVHRFPHQYVYGFHGRPLASGFGGNGGHGFAGHGRR